MAESTYSIKELIAAAEHFEQPAALIAAALKATGRDEFTLAEAESIINAFANKPVEV